jgi:hypothetical protein
MSEIDNNFPSKYRLGSQVFYHNLNGDFKSKSLADSEIMEKNIFGL